jgi:hypothetical protein
VATPYDAAVIDDARFALPATADERRTLTTFLDFQRHTLERKCAGLTDEQLRTRAVPPATLCLMGLMRHMAAVERWYFQCVIAGEQPPQLYPDTDAEFNDVDSATGQETLATWRAQIAQSRRVAAERELDAIGMNPGRRIPQSLRWVFHHMIDEYARHLGHADLLREVIDGETGE